MLTDPLQPERSIKIPEVISSIDVGEVNPFPGLRPFTVDEYHLFFGREGQVDDILLKLAKNKFVCVMGYSGSGKSSLMYCGLLPVLVGGFVLNSGPNWNVIITRPGTDPLQNLTDSIVDYLISKNRIPAEEMEVHKAIIRSVLKSGPHGLVEISRSLQQEMNENVFFMIDQFEELFRTQETVSEEDTFNSRQEYVNLLLNAIQQSDVPIYIAITMRSDFIAKCSVFPDLADEINKSNYLVPQMSREQKRIAIEGPVAVGGGKIADRLVKRLISDMGKNQDQLPILQHALMRTWDYWVQNHETDEPIDLRHYNAIGKVSQALSQHANELFEDLSTREKEIAEILFKSITEKSQDNRGMRRPCRLSLVAELAEADEEEVINVVEHFRKPGRSFLMPAHYIPLGTDSIIELSHESLMRIWNKLDVWVEEEFESAQMYKRLSEAAAMYQIGKTGLWRPPDLQLALNWQKKQRPTRAWAQRYDEAFERSIVFLDTSRITYEAELKNQDMLQKRTLRRARATAIILGIAALIAMLFFVFAYLQKIDADNNRVLAEQGKQEAIVQRSEAERQRLTAKYQQDKAVEQKNKAELANRQLQTTLLQLQVEKDRALRALQEAQRQELIAKTASEKEVEARIVVEKQTQLAKESFDSRNALLMLAKAQALAAKSVQEVDDKNLAGLQSMQAFNFHRKYGGKRYDPYIYSGLYHALKLLAGSSYNAIRVPGPVRNRINSIAVSSSSNKFFAAAADGRIFTGNYETLSGGPTTYENPYPNKLVSLSRDENYLVVGTDSASVKIHDLRTTKNNPLVVSGLKGSTHAIEFLPDNSGFIVSKSDKSISHVNHTTGKITHLLSLPFEVKSITISADGKWMAGGAWSGELVLINLHSKTYEIIYADKNSQVLSVRFSPDGNKIAFGTFEINEKRGLVKLYDLMKREKENRQFTGHRAGVYDVEFSPDGKLLASASSDQRVQMWVLDFPEDLPIVMDNNNGFIWDITFAKGSDYLIAACHESEIRVWPTDPDFLAQQVCPKLTRNMTEDEWNRYVGKDIDYEGTCKNIEQ
jgi:WD40 repeat protein/ABC-type oligopeptide transport system ATPase subunit